MLAAIFRVLALVRKELLAMFKDPRGRAVHICPGRDPVPGVRLCRELRFDQVTYAACDRDHSAASSELLASLDGSGVFRRVANLERAEDVKALIDQRRGLLVVEIDQDFERRLLSGQSADVQVIADGRNSNTANTAVNYVGTVVDAFNTKWWAGHGGGGPPVRITTRAWYNSEPRGSLEYHPGLDWYTHTGGDAPYDSDVHCAREGGGYFRPVTGHTLSPGGTHDG